MKILGKPIADQILQNLKKDITNNTITPKLAIVLASDNPAPRIYIKHKKQRAEEIGMELEVYEFSSHQKEAVLHKIEELNDARDVHGILVQLPMFTHWNSEEYIQKVSPSKDVDGFIKHSLYKPATALAVWEMLKKFAELESYKSPEEFLQNKNIVVLGRGRTAGGPITQLLKDYELSSHIIHSKTENPNAILMAADIVISATGKKHIIHRNNIKKGSYIIGIGVGREADSNKIIGDIDENTISEKAKYYCPTIGGIGPLTIACLLRNVAQSAMKSIQ